MQTKNLRLLEYPLYQLQRDFTLAIVSLLFQLNCCELLGNRSFKVLVSKLSNSFDSPFDDTWHSVPNIPVLD